MILFQRDVAPRFCCQYKHRKIKINSPRESYLMGIRKIIQPCHFIIIMLRENKLTPLTF